MLVITSNLDAQQNVQIFDETVSFESYVRDGQRQATRDPASLEANYRVIGVRRELALTEAEARRAPQDIIINAGTQSGLSQGSLLNVIRRVPVIDPFLDNQQKELEIPFARVRVIHAQANLSVARVERIDSIDAGPGVGIRGVLIGDHLSSR
jgi:hypothetical protein